MGFRELLLFNQPLQKWNAKLASMAERYATKCRWEHGDLETDDLPYKEVGQNLFTSVNEQIDYNYVIMKWFEEKIYFNFGARTCAVGNLCGHYTQVGMRVGLCVWHSCVTLLGVGLCMWHCWVWVCVVWHCCMTLLGVGLCCVTLLGVGLCCVTLLCVIVGCEFVLCDIVVCHCWVWVCVVWQCWVWVCVVWHCWALCKSHRLVMSCVTQILIAINEISTDSLEQHLRCWLCSKNLWQACDAKWVSSGCWFCRLLLWTLVSQLIHNK